MNGAGDGIRTRDQQLEGWTLVSYKLPIFRTYGQSVPRAITHLVAWKASITAHEGLSIVPVDLPDVKASFSLSGVRHADAARPAVPQLVPFG